MMFRALFSKILYGIGYLMALLLLLACLVPHAAIPALAFLSLMVPILVIGNILFFLLWFLVKRKLFWLSLSALVVGYVSMGTFLHFKGYDDGTEKSGLKVMSFNVQGFNQYEPLKRANITENIARFIAAEAPDIICFQEYGRVIKRSLKDYPYISETPYTNERLHQGVFSKYPIVGQGSLDFPNSGNNAIYADIVYGADTLRVYNLHLESLNVRPNSLKNEESKKLYGRLRYAFGKQQEQAKLVSAHASEAPFKTVICADMNNNQFSYTYNTIKGSRKDTFMDKGQGYGSTIKFWKFPLRIDFILVDPGITVVQHHNYSIGQSDHEPIMATLALSVDK